MNKLLIFISIILLVLLFLIKKDSYIEIVEFEIENGLPVIDVNINSRSAKLIIDTGATSSVLDAFSSYEYEYDCKMASNTYARGISGDSNIGYTSNVNFDINGKKVDLKFKCVNLNELGKKMNVLGILGNDYFENNNLIIDYNNLIIKRIDYENKEFKLDSRYITSFYYLWSRGFYN